ncbi:NUCLEAR FUSION DEFECTIVE 4-like protein [Drosera capensis]
MWIQSCAGIGYSFGSISPVIKSELGYNQRQIPKLGVAKDLGDSVGFLTGSLCEILPLWAALLVGAFQNLIGYGVVWLVVTGRAPPLPLWAMIERNGIKTCFLIGIGNDCAGYDSDSSPMFSPLCGRYVCAYIYGNTAALVSCVQNPKSRGPIVGILKGFAGLAGAILTQVYAVIRSPDHASLIFMIAVGPFMVVVALMFIVRPVGGHRQVRPWDGPSFSFVYNVCFLLAAYLMGVMLVEDLVDLSHKVIVIFTVFLFVLLLLPICIPIYMSYIEGERSSLEEALLPEPQKIGPAKQSSTTRIAQLQTKLAHAAAEGAVRVKRRKGPHRGEDFTLMQALIKADFWLIFFSLLFGSGSGLTVIDNLDQMSQSLGYDDTHIFVSMISIWNFLARIGGGYLSEVIVRDYAYLRPKAMAVAQAIMSVGHFLLGMGWPGVMDVGTLMIGLGYSAHWAVVPPTASELFGFKKFGALYNFLALANPAGSLVFSGLITSYIYDREA